MSTVEKEKKSYSTKVVHFSGSCPTLTDFQASHLESDVVSRRENSTRDRTFDRTESYKMWIEMEFPRSEYLGSIHRVDCTKVHRSKVRNVTIFYLF